MENLDTTARQGGENSSSRHPSESGETHDVGRAYGYPERERERASSVRYIHCGGYLYSINCSTRAISTIGPASFWSEAIREATQAEADRARDGGADKTIPRSP
jgi:hypothetical protein